MQITKQEIDKLPLWARIAFIGRCLRRLVPAIELIRSKALTDDELCSEGHIKPVEFIVNAAANAPMHKLQAKDLLDDPIFRYETALRRAMYFAVDAAVVASHSSSFSAEAKYGPGNRSVARFNAIIFGRKSSEVAFQALMELDQWIRNKSAPATELKIINSMRMDFDWITAINKKMNFSHMTGVEQDNFSVFWPDSPPVGWPELGTRNAQSSPLVFISYASEDRDYAIDLHRKLEKAGFHAWIDVKDLRPGEVWKNKIEETLKDSDFIVICLSSSSNKRGYIQKEIRVALEVAEFLPEDSICIIPARVEECKIPASLMKYQWVNVYEANGINQLIDSIYSEWTTRHETNLGRK